MKRARVGGLLAALLAAGASLATGSAGATGVPPQLSEAESQAVARVGAEHDLALFVPPPGSTPSTAEPAGDGGQLSTPSQLTGINMLELHRWWLVPAAPQQAIGYVKANPPAGARLALTENLEGTRSMPPISSIPTAIRFEWPAVSRARGQLGLEVLAVGLSDGNTGILVSAAGVWLRPRPASEAIPSGMRLLRITVSPYAEEGGPPVKTSQPPVTVTNPGRIERVVTLLNALSVAQPTGPEPCPAPFGVVLRLAFYKRPHGRPAAVVRDNLVPCGNVELEIAGHAEPALQQEAELPNEISEAVATKIDVRFTTPDAGP
ncbi:MAG: hypothetical protein ACLQBB_02200 [Solirubrobacteraceae bacterium]